MNHKTLFLKLDNYGFRGTFLSLIKSYLCERKQQVIINNYRSTFKTLLGGVPQGSILGPLLFNLYINDIVNIDKGCKIIVYADDTSLYFQEPTLHELEIKANTALRHLNMWSISNSLSINVSKTKAVLFRPKNKTIDLDLRLTIGACNVELVKTVKNLGVVFHEHMFWNDHVDATYSKLSRSVGVLCRLRFLIPQNIKLLLYNSLFCSTLRYCFLVWGTTTVTNLDKIHRLQKKAARAIENVAYDEHTAPIFQKLNMIHIHDLYNLVLLTRYKLYIKNNDLYLTQLAGLTNRPRVYDTRCTHTWSIPYTRTNYGRQMLKYTLPSTLNSFRA